MVQKNCKTVAKMMWICKIHYNNMPMQYTAIFKGCKNENFQKKNGDISLIFAQNMDCEYLLGPPRLKHRLWVHVKTSSTSTHNLMFQS